MNFIIKFIPALLFLVNLVFSNKALADESSKVDLPRNYAITPLSALSVLESIDNFPKLSELSYQLSLSCSAYDLRSLRQQILRGYFSSTLKEIDGKLIRMPVAFIHEEAVEISGGVVNCLRSLVQVSFVNILDQYGHSTYSLQRLLGIYEAFISLTDTFDHELKEFLTETAQVLRQGKSVLPSELQLHLSIYLTSLRKRQIITSNAYSKK